MTTAEKPTNTYRDPDRPISVAYSGTKLNSPAIPQTPVSRTNPGTIPAGWISRRDEPADPISPVAVLVSGTRRARATARAAKPTATSQAASNRVSPNAASPIGGPQPIPR
jgi:hypothetical protein